MKICIICDKEYEPRANNQKTCSEECAKEKNKIRHKKLRQIKEENAPVRQCKYCNKDYKRFRERNGFCSRSCASKLYIENGTYDKWRLLVQEKRGAKLKCEICNDEFYATPKDINSKKLCGNKDCRQQYMSNLFSGSGNPSFGKKESEESKKKRIETLNQKYGISNAYALAKHKMSSGPQQEIFNILSKKYGEKNVFLNYHIKNNNRFCYGDIVVKNKNVIIEYNGDYWHCNPEKYDYSFFNTRKQKYAYEIWKYDKERLMFLEGCGYNVFVVWEKNYLDNKKLEIKNIENFLNEQKEKNINDR